MHKKLSSTVGTVIAEYEGGAWCTGASYVGPTFSESLVKELLALPWWSRRAARHEYFMSTQPRQYSYGNRGTGDEVYDSQPFTILCGHLMNVLNEDLESNFNVCFLNKYDNQHQHLGWHADEFPGMREEEPIGVISFGAEREIWIKPKDYKGEIPPEWRITLGHGSLFVMPPGYQSTHLHRIPKHDRPCDYRISLTFRSFR